jgi:molybdate transport system substrate-binding protein
MTQVSEILGKPTAQFVALLPEALQNYTVFVAGMPAGGKASDAVMQFMAFLRGPVAAASIRSKGMQ